jgi:hypothetical protein
MLPRMDVSPFQELPRSFLHGLLISLGIFLITFFIFWYSPVTYPGDSKYFLGVSESLLSKGTFRLDDYSIPHNRPAQYLNTISDGEIHQIEIIDGHFYYFFPPGGPILTTPFVYVGHLLGWSVVKPDGTFDIGREVTMQLCIASLLMAALAVVLYQMSRLILSPGWSVCVALGGALGSPIWSTASRAMWGHTWGVLLDGIAIFLLLSMETGKRKVSPVVLATILSWAYFVRPTNIVTIAGITVFIVLFYRPLFIRYALTGAMWCAGFVLYSWENFHTILPSYFQLSRVDGGSIWGEPMLRNIISPSQGILINMPVIFFIGYLLIRYWRTCPHRRLVWLAIAVWIGQWITISHSSAGTCFGPRFMTELVPWMVLLAVLGIQAVLRYREVTALSGRTSTGYFVTLTTGAFLLLIGVLINGRGATSNATAQWNETPLRVIKHPSIVWSWRYPQWLAGIISAPPAVIPHLDDKRVLFGGENNCNFLTDGWSPGDPLFCWSEGHVSTVTFTTSHLNATQLRMAFRPHLVGDKLKSQRITIALNGTELTSFIDDVPEMREFTFAIPAGTLQTNNVLTIRTPDAVTPASVGENSDERKLGIALYWIELSGPTDR